MHPYKNQLAILTTKHEKLPLIAPAMLAVVGLEVTDINLDTDQLGTFSGELPRTASPLETAITKAKLGRLLLVQSLDSDQDCREQHGDGD